MACGVSVDTVKRRLPALEDAGAYKDARGRWMVTPDQLRVVGLAPGAPIKRSKAMHQAAASAPGAPIPAAPDDLVRRCVELEAALTLEKVKREAAEGLADERNRTIEVLRASLRMIEAGAPGTGEAPRRSESGASDTCEAPRRFEFARRSLRSWLRGR